MPAKLAMDTQVYAQALAYKGHPGADVEVHARTILSFPCSFTGGRQCEGKALSTLAERYQYEKMISETLHVEPKMSRKGQFISALAQCSNQIRPSFNRHLFPPLPSDKAHISHYAVGNDQQPLFYDRVYATLAKSAHWMTSLLSRIRDPLVFPAASAALADKPAPDNALNSMMVIELDTQEKQEQFIGLLTDRGVTETDALSEGIVREALTDKMLIISLTPQVESARYKRASSQLMAQMDNQAAEQYANTHCRIRTKTVAGDPIGDTMLVGAETFRNLPRALYEKASHFISAERDISQTEVSILEGGNLVLDIGLTFFLSPAYPILKFGMVKAVNVAGHAINGDMTCLKREFTAEAMADLLMNTEVGLTGSHLSEELTMLKPKVSPDEIAFTSSGAFVQEDLFTGIHTEKYLAIETHGEQVLIKEAQPGKFVTHHPEPVNAEKSEKEVVFDDEKKRLIFKDDLPGSHGYDFTVVDGSSFIKIQGNDYRIRYNQKSEKFEIKVQRLLNSHWVPVYREPLTKRWHLSWHVQTPVFNSEQVAILERIQVPIEKGKSYSASVNLNEKCYGKGEVINVHNLKEDIRTSQPQQTVIEMNGKLVPVQMIIIPGHGVRYTVDNAFPIEWDGARWVFEHSTSRSLSKKLSEEIVPEMYAKGVNADSLSPPDAQGLCWSRENKSYLKKNDHYVEINKLINGRYQLVSADPLLNRYLAYKDNMFTNEGALDAAGYISRGGLSGNERRQGSGLSNQRNPPTQTRQRHPSAVENEILSGLSVRQDQNSQIPEAAASAQVSTQQDSLNESQKEQIRSFVQQYGYKIKHFDVLDFSKQKNIDITMLLVEMKVLGVNTDPLINNIADSNLGNPNLQKKYRGLVQNETIQQKKSQRLPTIPLPKPSDASTIDEALQPGPSNRPTAFEQQQYQRGKNRADASAPRDDTHLLATNAVKTSQTTNTRIAEFIDDHNMIKNNDELINYIEGSELNFSNVLAQLKSKNINTDSLISRLRERYVNEFEVHLSLSKTTNGNKYVKAIIEWKESGAAATNDNFDDFLIKRRLDRRTISKYISAQRVVSRLGYDFILNKTNYPFSEITRNNVLAWKEKAEILRKNILFNIVTERNMKALYAAYVDFVEKLNLNLYLFRYYINYQGFVQVRGNHLLKMDTPKAPMLSVNSPALKRPAATLSVHQGSAAGSQAAKRIIIYPASPDVINSGEFRLQREINDNLPILRDPQDMTKSLLQQEEGNIDDIKINVWGVDMKNAFATIPANQHSGIKKNLLEEVKVWLRTEGQHAERFSEIMEVRQPVPGDGPERGNSVYARRDIKQFEVLGPYSGMLHLTDNSLSNEMRREGAGNVLTYLWETRAKGRSVSGLQHGNTLSLINTSQLPGAASAWKRNNVTSVRVGKNLTFYVAVENINAGDELLVSYGETYNPYGVDIKEEMPDSPNQRR